MSCDSACDLHTRNYSVQARLDHSPSKTTLSSGRAGPLPQQTNPDLTHQLPWLFTRAAGRRRGPRPSERCCSCASDLRGHSGPSLMFSESLVGFFPRSPTFHISPFSFLPFGVRGGGVSSVEGSGS